MDSKDKIRELGFKFPEPPDEISVPTDESQNQWNAYREAVKKFHQLLTKWGAPYPEGDISEENSVVWRYDKLIEQLKTDKI